MVVLAQALVSHPRFVIIDELSLGLAPVVVKRLIPTIRSVAEAGAGVLLIEQFATLALGLANRAYIMEGGRIQYSGMASELQENPAMLHSAYLLRTRNGAGTAAAGDGRPATPQMSVTSIEHVLVLSDDIDATRDFYCARGRLDGRRAAAARVPRLLALRRRDAVRARRRAPALRGARRGPRADRRPSATRGSGPVDHIAFNATDYDAARRAARAQRGPRREQRRPRRAAPGVHRGSERRSGRNQREELSD